MDCCKTKDEKGCCKDLNKKTFFGYTDEKGLIKESKKAEGGNKKMNTRITLWVFIGALFVTALFLTFKAGAGSVESVQAVTDAAKSTALYGGMVGGC